MGKLGEFRKPELFWNRELSWLLFDRRVLSEAKNSAVPLFERLKFLSITASNLDEFFMVRASSLQDMVNAGYKKPDIAGLSPKEQLCEIDRAAHLLVNEQYDVYKKHLLPELKEAGIRIIARHEDLSKSECEFVDKYFHDNVYPVLTPMAVDSSRPFPLIRNKSLNIGALVTKKGKNAEYEFAMVQVPSVLPRIIRIPDRSGEVRIILLEEVIERNIKSLFLNYNIVCASPFRIMRNADLTIEEDEAEDLLQEIEKQLRKRQWGQIIRLEVDNGIDERLLGIILKALSLSDSAVYRIGGPIDLTFLMSIFSFEGFEELRDKDHIPAEHPRLAGKRDLFAEIRKGDVLLHHPYQSFAPVVNFIRNASKDPNVLAIKQTLYRVSGHSPIVAALAEAAENGKQVTVLVELKARFDEENNIVWAKQLEKAGCHVIYGLVGLKTHCKIALIVRREEDGIRRYVHLGTGNYNDTTAAIYTDFGLFTCNEEIGEDATSVFNMLSGYSEPLSWNKLSLAPVWLKKRFRYLIDREIKFAREGKKGEIIAKMNALCDPDIIAALYEASSQGVKITLIIRGICCLKVGIPGVSDNIHVRSIVGRFLEHGRIFVFGNGGKREVYMGSADWMPRNLDRRVEIMFPIEDRKLKEEVIGVLEDQLRDNVKAHILKKNGTYQRASGHKKETYSYQDEYAFDYYFGKNGGK